MCHLWIRRLDIYLDIFHCLTNYCDVFIALRTCYDLLDGDLSLYDRSTDLRGDNGRRMTWHR